MKFVKLNISFLVIFVVSLSVSAQKPTATPKIKQVPKTLVKTTPKTPDISAENKAKAEEFVKQGKAFWKEFEIRPAIDSFTKAIELNPNHVEALTERGMIYFMINEDKNAVPDLDKVLKIEPNNLKALYFRGLALTDIAITTKDEENDRKTAGDIAQKALADFNKAIELSPNDLTYYNGRGELILAFGFYKEAVADFEKSISIAPNSIAYTKLGLAKFYLGEKDAIEQLDKAVKLAPTFAEAFYVRATINRDEGRYVEALKDFDEAIKQNKYSEKYYNTRGMLYFRLKDGYMAVADFTRAIQEKKEYATAYFNRAMTYKKFPYSVSTNDDVIGKIRLQHEKMLEDFTSAIKYKPNFDEAYVERGLINATDMRNKDMNPDAETINRLKLGLADFEQAVKYNPKNARAYNGRAMCNERLGKKELALADYTKAIELDPTLETAYMGRMAIYCETGKKELSFADEKKIKELGFAAINICSFGK